MVKKYALLSVSNKDKIEIFAQNLVGLGFVLLSTGGTLRHLKEYGIPVTAISEYTQSPEILGGRVKTLHPKIHGGILARREMESDILELSENEINLIDIVVVNLYPFSETIKKQHVSLEEAIENIDIGGPTMLRAAAKNYRHTTVIVDSDDYQPVIDEIKEHQNTLLKTREKLAVKTFSHTATYDSTIDQYLSKNLTDEPSLRLHYQKGIPLRYGENSHQKGNFFVEPSAIYPQEETIASAKKLHGKEISYNNIVDANAALELCKEFWDVPAVAIIKHANPCGLATGKTLSQAFEMAWQGDPVSAFGSVIACSQKMDLKTAKKLKGRFVEIIIAPDYEEDAITFLKNKSKDLRILSINANTIISPRKIYKHVLGGMLVQDRNILINEKWDCVTKSTFSNNQQENARFAWKLGKHTKSNAIVASYQYEEGVYMLMGSGPGQPNRIDSNLKLCQPRIIENAKRLATELNKNEEDFIKEIFQKVILASDAFFPFDDNIRACNKVGIRYIIQPGGSKRDEEVINTANELGIAMIFTGTRHFNH